HFVTAVERCTPFCKLLIYRRHNRSAKPRQFRVTLAVSGEQILNAIALSYFRRLLCPPDDLLEPAEKQNPYLHAPILSARNRVFHRHGAMDISITASCHAARGAGRDALART